MTPARSPRPEASFREMLSGGDPRALRGVGAVVELALAEPTRCDELVRCVLDGDDEIVRMRAADALEKVSRARPPLLGPYVPVLLGTMSTIEQPSVQWHVAQMLGRARLTPSERTRAAWILRRYLDTSSDWIVLNCSLDAMAGLARQDPDLRGTLLGYLHGSMDSGYRSLSSRARKLLAEFGP